MKSIMKHCLSALFPAVCGLCAKPAALDENGICAECGAALPLLSAASIHLDRGLLGDCALDEAVAVFAYREPVKDAIHRLKFYGKRHAGLCLASGMARSVNTDILDGIDFATAVPVTKKRRRAIGYNHAEVLAEEFCRLTNIPCRFDLLIKIADKPSQLTLKSAGERAQNVKGVYGTADGVLLPGSRVLIIDDVLTTGSTLNECAAALKRIGAKRVVCLAAAHPDFLQ